MPKCAVEIAIWRKCSPVNLLHIFGATFYKNTYGGLLLKGINLIKFAWLRKSITLLKQAVHELLVAGLFKYV